MQVKERLQQTFLEVEEGMLALISELGAPSKLREAVEYSLLSGGKRVRPLLVMLIGDALGKNYPVLSSALAVECFHSASLIADDLPCMDNETKRRGKPCLHHVYPESVAILASYTLISLGYEYVHKNGSQLPVSSSTQNTLSMKALQTVTKAAGIFGATGGQFFDLFPPDQTVATLDAITEKKTVTLFNIAFVCGWLFGGGDPACLSEVEALALHLGRAFQLRDDLLDLEQDTTNATESNLASILGKKSALQRLEHDLQAFRMLLKKLSIDTKELCYMADALSFPA